MITICQVGNPEYTWKPIWNNSLVKDGAGKISQLTLELKPEVVDFLIEAVKIDGSELQKHNSSKYIMELCFFLSDLLTIPTENKTSQLCLSQIQVQLPWQLTNLSLWEVDLPIMAAKMSHTSEIRNSQSQ